MDDTHGGRPLGTLILRIDPTLYLYPFIQTWPVQSRTSETLIIRREGNDVLFLNELRFQKNTALNLRVSLGKDSIAAVRAVLGEKGIIEAADYRGVPVIAEVRPVPDSPWFLVARVDRSEVYEPLRERLWIVIMTVGALIAASGGGVGFVWRHQRSRFYLEQYKSAEALRERTAYLESLFNYANAPIIVWDPTLLIVRFNHAFEQLTGYREEEVKGKEIEMLFPKGTVKHSLDLIHKAVGGDQWETVEIEIQRKNGESRLVLWNSANILDKDGKSVVATIAQGHDITER
jgi:PAS domain S-box-containing protein